MSLRPLISFSSDGLVPEAVDTTNAVIRGVSVLTSGLIARGHDLTVDSTTLEQMHAAAEAKGKIPVKVNHKSGAEAVCGFLTNFQIEGKKLKADWHLLKTHPQKDQILEVAKVMPSGVGLSASFLPPEKPEAGKARCEELLSVDYVTLPAANPDGLFSARVEDAATARRKASVAKAAKVAGAGVLGAVGAASIAARGVDRAASLGLRKITPRVRTGIIGAAAGIGAVQTARAVAQNRKRPAYADPRELAADYKAALIAFGATRAEAAQEAAALVRADHEHGNAVPHLVHIKPRRSLGKRVAIRAAKIGVGAAGGALIGRKLGTAAGAATGAAAGLLFQSRATRNAVRSALQFSARLNRSPIK